MQQDKKRRTEERQDCRENSAKEHDMERKFTVRPLNMEDFKDAKNQVKHSLLT